MSYAEDVYPDATWETRAPEEVGLSTSQLDAPRELAGGRGCVVKQARHQRAAPPGISTLPTPVETA